jgi:hypothetical protein
MDFFAPNATTVGGMLIWLTLQASASFPIVSRQIPLFSSRGRVAFDRSQAAGERRMKKVVPEQTAPAMSPPKSTPTIACLSDLPPETVDRLKELARMIGRQLARESRT